MHTAKRHQVTSVRSIRDEAAGVWKAPVQIPGGQRQVPGRMVNPQTVAAISSCLAFGIVWLVRKFGHAAAYLAGCWTATGSNGSPSGL